MMFPLSYWIRQNPVIFRGLSILIATFFLGVTLAGCSRDSVPEPAHSSVSGLRSAPDFELKDPDGRSYRLNDFKGQAVVLHFWASWCPPCIEEIPRWIQAAPLFKGVPVKLIAISVDETWDKALKVYPKAAVAPNTLSLLDPTGEVARKYGTRQFPETYVLSRDLRIVEKLAGSQDWTNSRIRFLLAQALAQSGK